MSEAVFVAKGKFDKSAAYLLKWLIKREGYSTGLKQKVTTKMNEYKNLERILNIPLQIYINLELVFLKLASYRCRAAE